MKRPLKISIISIIVFIAVIQLIRPERNSTDTISQADISRHVEIPGDVKDMLRNACNDCHSENTVWPWYSNFSPVSWLLVYDVNSGKERLNFSEWDDYSDMRKASNFLMICDVVSSGEMPLFPYKMMHKEARLTDEERSLICTWAEKQNEREER